MSETSMFINGTLFSARLGSQQEVEIIRMGKVLEDPLPEPEWEEIKKEFLSKNHAHFFSCNSCHETVFVTVTPEGTCYQGCRCTLVFHYTRCHFTAEGWDRFRELFKLESLRPVPADGLKKDPLTGQYAGLNGKGKKWMRDRMGLSEVVKISDDARTFSIGDSSVTHTKEGSIFRAGDDPGEVHALAKNIYVHRKSIGVEAPPRLVALGIDPDYVWPDVAVRSRISSVPFCCPACHARVKRAPVRVKENVDEIWMCFCMSIFFRRDTERPSSSGDWKEIMLEEQEMQVRMRAATSDSKS
jgi:hypothetical protein